MQTWQYSLKSWSPSNKLTTLGLSKHCNYLTANKVTGFYWLKHHMIRKVKQHTETPHDKAETKPGYTRSSKLWCHIICQAKAKCLICHIKIKTFIMFKQNKLATNVKWQLSVSQEESARICRRTFWDTLKWDVRCLRHSVQSWSGWCNDWMFAKLCIL